MSNSTLVSYTKISPNRTSLRNHAIDTVTVHCYVGQVSVEDMAAWLCNPAAEASANYGIGSDGRIGLFVDESDRSWCSSNRENDNRAITIECASDKTHPYAVNDKVYASLINLLVDICKRNGIDALRWQADKSLIGQPEKQNMTAHRWFAAKECPGDYLYNRFGQIAAEVNARLGSGEAAQPEEKEWLRVRRNWEDASSQIGAFEDLENAIAACLPGYSVFDNDGNVVYSLPAAGFQGASLKGLTEEERIKKIAPLYVESAKTTGMLPSVGIAQFCLESGYGSTDLAEYANNLHGMKCILSGNSWEGSVWDGKSRYGKYSPEVIDGKTVQKYSEFRAYQGCEDSIADRAAYFKNAMNGDEKRYPGIAGETNYEKVVHIIKSGEYATDPNYESKLKDLITRWKLYEYDQEFHPVRDPEEPEESEDKGGLYTVQAGAYTVRENAETRVRELKAAGFDSFIFFEDNFYKIQAGAYEIKENAETQVERLKAAGFSAFIR